MLTPRSVPFGGPALPALKAYEEHASPTMPTWVLVMFVPEGSLGHRCVARVVVATVLNWRKPRLYPACCSSIGRIETNPLMLSTSEEAAKKPGLPAGNPLFRSL